MKKIFFVCPHLSTGGLPQYVLKQIQSFVDEYDIYVIEVKNLSNEYTVQRDQITPLTVHYCLQVNQNEEPLYKHLVRLIKTIKPDVVYFQEIPEHFLPYDICKEIFVDERDYDILITTHGSKTQPEKLLFYPDRFVLVNEWSRKQFEEKISEVETDVWEYPIEDKVPTLEEKAEARRFLGFDETKRNVLNVGLFTPGKNQGELFEVARKNPDTNYHFVGNMSGTFASYWQPLMKNKPKNCILWGERKDVDTFYKAADEFYFTSNFELNPLVIKEALSYGLPVKMKRLPTYLDDYDNNPLVTYINENKVENKKVSNSTFKLMHCFTKIEDEREQRSKHDVFETVDALRIKYEEVINAPFVGMPPKETCMYPDAVTEKANPNATKLTLAGGHYGAFTSFKKIFMSGWEKEADYLIFAECDTLISNKPLFEEHLEWIKTKGHDYDVISLGSDVNLSKVIHPIDDLFTEVENLYETHLLVVSKERFQWWKEAFETHGWNTTDYWLNEVKRKEGLRFAVANERSSIQANGISLIDNVFRNKEPQTTPSSPLEAEIEETSEELMAYVYDQSLSESLVELAIMHNYDKVFDFGRKVYEYANDFKDNGIEVIVDDTNGEEANLVFCFQTADDIPKQNEETFLENICNAVSKNGLIVISWALPDETQYIEQTNEYVKNQFTKRNFIHLPVIEKRLRTAASKHIFKNTLMVFKRK